MAYELIVIGCSWGGLGALLAIAGGLPPTFDVPIVIVSHRSRNADTLLMELLQDQLAQRVRDAEDKDVIARGTVYIAPPDYHLLVERGHLSLSTDEPVRFSRPSIDVTFETAADAYGAHLIGVVLTGANDDGARGLLRVADRHGYAVVQDPKTAEVPIMPQAALCAVPTAQVLGLQAIAPRLVQLCAPHRARSVPLERRA